MSPRRSTTLAGLVVVLAVTAVASAVWLLPATERSLNARVADVASGLRCPTCDAVSVSASNSPIAQSMRDRIRQQLRTGRSPEQIRTWFAQRYGDRVLLEPKAEGFGALLWIIPGAALAAGLGMVGVLHRRGRGDDGGAGRTQERRGRSSPRSALSARRVGVAALAVLVVGTAVPAALWSSGAGESGDTASASGDTGGERMGMREWVDVGRTLEHQEAYDAASRAYRKALRRQPRNAAVRNRLAFVLVRAGHADQAIPVVRDLAHKRGPQRDEALLMLGLAQRAESLPQAARTLRRFLALAPDHPAAAQVRRLLREDS